MRILSYIDSSYLILNYHVCIFLNKTAARLGTFEEDYNVLLDVF